MNEERRIETEEVESVAPPPRARVTPEFERKRDYLAGFLSGQPEDEEPKGGAGSDLQAAVVETLKSIFDPEFVDAARDRVAAFPKTAMRPSP